MMKTHGIAAHRKRRLGGTPQIRTRGLVSTFLTLVALVGLTVPVWAIEAQKFTQVIDTAGAKSININQDHYTVELVDGWISSKDKFLRSLISGNTSLVVATKRTIPSFDTTEQPVEFSSIYQAEDVGSKIDRPLQLGKALLTNVPADSDIRVEFKLTVNREANLTKIFGLLDKQAPIADFMAAPWVGYSKVVASVVNEVFGADKSKFPFYWEGGFRESDAVSPEVIKPHYEILIAPNKDGDNFFMNLDRTKLAYNEAQSQLQYDGKPLRDHTYMVLKVTKAAGYDVGQLVFESEAPWATVALTQFVNGSTTPIDNKDQLKTAASNFLDKLNLLAGLLKKERRFNKYERAVALYAFSEQARKYVSDKCAPARLNLAGNKCPDGELKDYSSKVAATFKLPTTNAAMLTTSGAAVVNKINQPRP